MFTKKRIIALAIIVVLIFAVPVMAGIIFAKGEIAQAEMQMLTVWQIDGFEGGKGSRAQYLKDKSKQLFKDENIFINVISLTAEAAEENIKAGDIPDMISCSPTFNAHIRYINDTDFVYKTWCYGSYCLLSLNGNDDFKITDDNTVINSGKDNLTAVAAAMVGAANAKKEEPTNAYLQLLNGKYRYLLGTQRDIFRLKARNVTFSVKQIYIFNDLYQNICITTGDSKRYVTCKKFIEYITANNDDTDKIGLLSANAPKFDGELGCLQEKQVEYELKAFCGDSYLNELKSAAAANDVNKIKSLLK